VVQVDHTHSGGPVLLSPRPARQGQGLLEEVERKGIFTWVQGSSCPAIEHLIASKCPIWDQSTHTGQG
jgi:hypothetical protein